MYKPSKKMEICKEDYSFKKKIQKTLKYLILLMNKTFVKFNIRFVAISTV